MKKRVLQRLLDVANFELAACINKHMRLLAAYHELEERAAAQAEGLSTLRAGFHDGRRERNDLNTEIGVLENRVKMLRAGLEDGKRERDELRDEVAELKRLLFNRGAPTPNPQPQPLIRSTPRRFWRADRVPYMAPSGADRVPYMAPSGADISKPRPWWKSTPS